MRCIVFLLLSTALFFSRAEARLADDLDQAILRYGKPETVPSNLLETAKERVFKFNGWRIRCAFLTATDGREYVVREEYTKVWNAEVMKAGGSPTITDDELSAVLKGEAGKTGWSRKLLAKPGGSLTETFTNQIMQSTGLAGVIWVRADGAECCATLGRSSIRLQLPQAIKFEAELKAIKDVRRKAMVPTF